MSFPRIFEQLANNPDIGNKKGAELVEFCGEIVQANSAIRRVARTVHNDTVDTAVNQAVIQKLLPNDKTQLDAIYAVVEKMLGEIEDMALRHPDISQITDKKLKNAFKHPGLVEGEESDRYSYIKNILSIIGASVYQKRCVLEQSTIQLRGESEEALKKLDQDAGRIARLVEDEKNVDAATEIIRRNSVCTQYIQHLWNELCKKKDKLASYHYDLGEMGKIPTLAQIEKLDKISASLEQNQVKLNDDSLQDVFVKYHHVRQVQSKLNEKNVSPLSLRLAHFDERLKESLPTITKRRDGYLMTFLKGVGVALSLGLAYSKLFGGNATEGKKMAKRLRTPDDHHSSSKRPRTQ